MRADLREMETTEMLRLLWGSLRALPGRLWGWLRARDSHAVRNWVEVVAIILAGGWAYYRFVYEASKVRPLLVLSSSIEQVAGKRLQGRDSVICLRARVNITNRSQVRVYALGVWYKLTGTFLVRGPTQNPNDSSAYASFTKQRIKDGYRSASRHYYQTSGPVVSTGWFLEPEWWFEPDEEASASFLVFIPANRYDAVRLEVFVDQAKDQEPFHTRWGVAEDGSLEHETYLKLDGFAEDTLRVKPFEALTNPAQRPLAEKYSMFLGESVSELSLWRPRRDP